MPVSINVTRPAIWLMDSQSQSFNDFMATALE